jgi:hypothetical protein
MHIFSLKAIQLTHSPQESICQIHAQAYAFDMLPIFMIPNTFNLLTFNSSNHATHIYDGIQEFNNPALTNDSYFNWQTFLHTFGAKVKLKATPGLNSS